MSKITDVLLPADERGNDANDFLDDAEYMSKIESVPASKVESVTDIRPDNEDDVALRFSEKYKDVLRYVAEMGRWYIWRENVWSIDRDLTVYDLIRNHCRDLLAGDNQLRTKMLNAGTIAATERLIKSDRYHAATVEQWDADDWILNTPGGTIDLKTGAVSPNQPHQHCTKITTAGPKGDCPIFKQFLNDVTANNQDLIDFIQRVMGYACTGSTKEHALFFFYGTGANGKGTLLNAVTSILNDYAVIASTEVFTESRHDRHPTELAALMGARLVVAQETDEGRKWAESRLKMLTGGDPITARFMRQDFFTFPPKFKLIIAGNHKPSIQTVDEAMRRRLNLVPFTVTIPKERRDPDLAEKLQQESAGIMQWLIDGALAYQEQGLSPPQAVLEATESYFEDEDTLAQWIAECCEIDASYWDKPTLLFSSWKDFAAAANFLPGTNKNFKSKLEAAGYRYHRTGPRGRHYEGIKTKSSYSD